MVQMILQTSTRIRIVEERNAGKKRNETGRETKDRQTERVRERKKRKREREKLIWLIGRRYGKRRPIALRDGEEQRKGGKEGFNWTGVVD